MSKINKITVDETTYDVEDTSKQPILTAGNNITIENNVISATDTTYENATTETNGLMSSEDKSKLDGLNNYSLPIASADTLGGIKIGENLNIDENGVLSSGGGDVEVGEYILIPHDSQFGGTYTSGNSFEAFKKVLHCLQNNLPFTAIFRAQKYRDSGSLTSYYCWLKSADSSSSRWGLTFSSIENVYNSSLKRNVISAIDNYISLNINTDGSLKSASISMESAKSDLMKFPTTGYNATKTQVLKNVSGTLEWVDEV